MSKLIKIEFVKFGPARVIGKMIVSNGFGEGTNPIPAFWQKCMQDGTFQILGTVKDQALSPDYTGWMGGMDEINKKFDYIAGMFMKPGTAVPNGFEYRDLPAVTMAVAWIKGPEVENYMQAWELTTKAMKAGGYDYDEPQGYMAEVYNYDRFVVPMNNKEKEVTLDYYVPAKRVNGNRRSG